MSDTDRRSRARAAAELAVKLSHHFGDDDWISIRIDSFFEIDLQFYKGSITDGKRLADRLKLADYEVRPTESAHHHLWSGEYGGHEVCVIVLIDRVTEEPEDPS